MKRIKLNILQAFTLLALFFTFSCSNNADEIQLENRSIELKFENNNIQTKSSSSYNTYTVEIISISPLIIESDELEVIEVKNHETNEISYAIV